MTDLSAMTSKDRLKILCIVSHSSAGGAQEIWVNLAEGLKARGHQVVLVALYPYRAEVRETPEHLPWTYVVHNRPTSLPRQLAMFAALTDLLKREEADVALTAMTAANTMVPLAAAVAGVRTRIITSHHSPSQTYSKRLDMLDGHVGRLARVQHIVAVSQTVAASLEGRSFGYRRKIRVITNALPPGIERLVAELAASRKPGQGRLVVATGRLAAQKNYPVLIRAAQHLPDVRFRVVGDGPDEEALKAQAQQLGIADRIEFTGFRPRDEALALLAEGDIFVQPSLYEGHSLGLVEAAKLGLPLVVSNVPSQVEALQTPAGPAGLIVAVADDIALAAAIRRLLDDPSEHRCYARKARVLGRAASFTRMLNDYEKLFG